MRPGRRVRRAPDRRREGRRRRPRLPDAPARLAAGDADEDLRDASPLALRGLHDRPVPPPTRQPGRQAPSADDAARASSSSTSTPTRSSRRSGTSPEKTPLGRRVWLALATYTGLPQGLPAVAPLARHRPHPRRRAGARPEERDAPGLRPRAARAAPRRECLVRAPRTARRLDARPARRGLLGVPWSHLARALQADLKAAGVMRPGALRVDREEPSPARPRRPRVVRDLGENRGRKARRLDRLAHRPPRPEDSRPVHARRDDARRPQHRPVPRPHIGDPGLLRRRRRRLRRRDKSRSPTCPPSPPNEDLRDVGESHVGDHALSFLEEHVQTAQISAHLPPIVVPVVAGSIPVTHPDVGSSDHTPLGTALGTGGRRGGASTIEQSRT